MFHTLQQRLQTFLFFLSLCFPSLQSPKRLQYHPFCLFISSSIPIFQPLIIWVILAFLLSFKFLSSITITRLPTAKILNLTQGEFITCHVARAIYILRCLCLMIWYFKYKASPTSIPSLLFPPSSLIFCGGLCWNDSKADNSTALAFFIALDHHQLLFQGHAFSRVFIRTHETGTSTAWWLTRRSNRR